VRKRGPAAANHGQWLWEQTFLLTDLRPPLTTDDVAQYVAARLEDIPDADEERAQLSALLDCMAAFDSAPADRSVAAFHSVLEQACLRMVRRNRRLWDVPRHVCLTAGDNRLILDLEEEAQASEIKAELDKLTEGGWLVLQEVVPALDEAWLPGPEGTYYFEFILPLMLRPDMQGAGQHSCRFAILPR
jgi:hypothetical protein